ncbi:MAG: HAD-IIIA family hydrolase [Pseudomonadales bacterium]
MTQDYPTDLKPRLAAIKWLILDVDGVLTDGVISYDSAGNEQKCFNIKDGLGIKLLQKAGIQVAIITGRVSLMVQRRADELGISHLIQGREDKVLALKELAEQENISMNSIAYIGDDLPDYKAIACAGFGVTVADGHPDVREVADHVTDLAGGQGAVREFCDFLLKAQGKYEQVTSSLKNQ